MVTLELNRREALLAHYATREPTDWTQFDLKHFPGGDGLAVDDENGDIAYSTTTSELWTGVYPVRIHIRRGFDKDAAVRLLHKAISWIEAGGLYDDTPGSAWPTAADRHGAGHGAYHDPVSNAF
jgi:hypothetical protein